MRVISKFLTADVRIVRVRVERRKIVMEGMVKELMPMEVELGTGDVVPFLGALARSLRDRIAARLPERPARMG